MGKHYGENSFAPQAHERNEGNSVGICGLVPHKGGSTPPGYLAYLTLDKEMIARASKVDAESNLKMTQKCLDRAYLSYPCDIFKINNSGRLQMQNQSCRAHTMTVKRKHGIKTSMTHSIMNCTQSSRALWIMATVEWTKALKSATFSKYQYD